MRPGDEIVVSGLDHQANVDPWIAAARDNELIVRTWEPDLADCTLRLDDLDAVLNDRTRLVAVGWASNAVGTINPIAEIAKRAHAVGAWVYVDAVHAAPHLPLDARAVDADFVACSAYKFFGPARRRGLRAARDPRDGLPAYKVRPADHKFQTGTGNFEGYAGAAAAVEYLADLGSRYGGAPARASRRERVVAGMRAIRAYEMDLHRHLAGAARGDRRHPAPRAHRRGRHGAPDADRRDHDRRRHAACRRRGARRARASRSGTATSTRRG